MFAIDPDSDVREEAGQRALALGNWQEARRLFEQVLARRPSPVAQEGLGWAGWWLADADLTFASRESAFQLYRAAGDNAGAGRVATWLAADFREFRGEDSVGRGWLERAERLLADLPESADHGWLALIEADFALSAGSDLEVIMEYAAHATDLGRRLDLADIEAVGLSIGGLARVDRGEMEDGMRMLDEASAIALGEDLKQPISSCWALCCLISACDAVGDLDRASASCKSLREIADRWGGRQVVGICRSSYGRVLCTRGEWADAEKELTGAILDFEASRPAIAAHGLLRLGELRARQGRAQQARELFEQCGPAGAVGLGGLALDLGDAQGAAEYAERALRRLPEEARIERVPALELLAQAKASLGEHESSWRALEQLEQAASPYRTPYMRGRVHSARGHCAAADGQVDEARRSFEDAIDCFSESSAPYEEALARLGLAEALSVAGRAERAEAEAATAQATFARLGADRDVRRAGPLATAAGVEELTGRELEVLRLIAQGMSDVAIAEQLILSPHTVHRHVANIRVKLRLSSRAAAVAYAARQGLL